MEDETSELIQDAIHRYECLLGLKDGKGNCVSNVTMAIDAVRFGHLVLPRIEIPGMGMRPVFDHDKAVAFVCGVTGWPRSVCEQGVSGWYTRTLQELCPSYPEYVEAEAKSYKAFMGSDPPHKPATAHRVRGAG
jgi:hypothetical protein